MCFQIASGIFNFGGTKLQFFKFVNFDFSPNCYYSFFFKSLPERFFECLKTKIPKILIKLKICQSAFSTAVSAV